MSRFRPRLPVYQIVKDLRLTLYQRHFPDLIAKKEKVIRLETGVEQEELNDYVHRVQNFRRHIEERDVMSGQNPELGIVWDKVNGYVEHLSRFSRLLWVRELLDIRSKLSTKLAEMASTAFWRSATSTIAWKHDEITFVYWAMDIDKVKSLSAN